MTDREKLVELLDKKQYQGNAVETSVNYIQNSELADYLLENGVIVPPDELYTIVDKGTRWANVMSVTIEHLSLFEIKNPIKYGYYFTREEAEKALKEREQNDG